jgi:hypothetical protein
MVCYKKIEFNRITIVPSSFLNNSSVKVTCNF